MPRASRSSFPDAAGSPSVSVVVAVHGRPAGLADCLDAHERELEDGDEILVVTDQAESSLAAEAIRRPRMRVLTGGDGANTPRLWTVGISASRSDLVRLTIASIVPAAGWRRKLAETHALGVDAIGGAIDAGVGLRLRDWAILFLRYHRYVPPWRAHESADVPGDHAAYRRDTLLTCRDMWAEEFWETEVNARLAREGRRLLIDPAFAAAYRGGESAAWFIGMRWSHGIRFGRDRAARASGATRAAHVLAFVLPGAVFLWKITRSVLARRSHLARYLAAVPWMGVFLLAWSLGEWVGWIAGPRAGRSE